MTIVRFPTTASPLPNSAPSSSTSVTSSPMPPLNGTHLCSLPRVVPCYYSPRAMPPDPHTKRGLARGIRWDSLGLEAYVTVHGRCYYKRFPYKTPLRDIAKWREGTRQNVLELAEELPILARTTNGWCYLYAAASNDGRVKIGKSLNAPMRLREISVGHSERLTLVMNIPGHALLECAIHAKFHHLALGQEWFTFAPDLREFLEKLNRGDNPINLLWDVRRI